MEIDLELEVEIAFTEDCYDNVCQFWQKYGHPVIAKDFLPKKVLVCIGEYNRIMYAFPYETDSKGIILDFFVGNKEVHKETRKEAIVLIIKFAEKYYSKKGYKYFYAFTDSESMYKHYEQSGFKVSSSNAKSFFKEF